MEWFYQSDGQEIGPISANDLKALFKAKKITAETLVRPDKTLDWKPLRHFKKSTPPPKAPVVQSVDTSPLEMENRNVDTAPQAAAPSPPVQPSSRCSECGRVFPLDDMIRFDDALICAVCKPVFTQKLREGVRVQGTLDYAGFWIRFGAKFIDMLIVGVVGMIAGFGIGLVLGAGFDESAESLAVNFAIQAVNILIPAVYGTYFIGRYGATLGKMACGIKVVRPDGGTVSYPRALGRHFAEYLSGMILAIGYIMAAFDSEKRSLHDRICSTRVVRK
jgi:uncharacterized RDD family membrane protein YckC